MARKSRNAIKKEKQEIISNIKDDIRKANFKLAMLERYYGKDSWASTNLKNTLNRKKIQGISLDGKIRADESMSLTQLRAVEKATKNFLVAKSSTYKGIKQIKKSVINTFRSKYGDIVDDNKLQKLSLEDAQLLYSILEDEKTASVVESIGSSRMITLVSSNIKSGASKEDYYKSLSNLIDVSTLDDDDDTRKALEEIYKKISKE